jgi:hypothetical protein
MTLVGRQAGLTLLGRRWFVTRAPMSASVAGGISPPHPGEEGPDPQDVSEDEARRFLDHAGVGGHEPSSFEQDVNAAEEPPKP